MSDGLEEQAVMAGRADRIRDAITGLTVEGIDADRMQELRDGSRLPSSLEYALIAEATGHSVDWLLHDREARDAASAMACTAVRYGGRDLCGCEDCIECTAEQDSEDGC